MACQSGKNFYLSIGPSRLYWLHWMTEDLSPHFQGDHSWIPVRRNRSWLEWTWEYWWLKGIPVSPKE